MISKNEALSTIESINKTIKESLKPTLRSDKMIAIALYIMAIPFTELFFQSYIDPVFNIGTSTTSVMFALRTLFYWGTAMGLGKLFPREEALHPAVAMAFSFDRFFPGICVATAAVLASSGYSNLIWPIISLLIGLDFLWVGIFLGLPFKILGWSYIGDGLLGIYFSHAAISNLWMYSVFFQGLAFLSVALCIYGQQKKHQEKS